MSAHRTTAFLVLTLGVSWSSSAFAAAPIAISQSATLAEDTVRMATLRAVDPERGAVTLEIVTPPAHGTVTLSGARAQYRPDANYVGTDSFTFRGLDAEGLYSTPGTVSLTVTAVNDAPTTSNTSASGDENMSLTMSLPGSDVDGDAITWSLTSAPGVGSVSVNPTTGEATYTPTASWSGTTSFRYQVSDGVLTAGGTATVTIVNTNDPPVASSASATMNEDSALTMGLTATDTDSSSLTYSILTGPANGTATLSSRSLTYVPSANFNGTDTITFVVSDGEATSAPATVTVTVNPVNDVPTLSASNVTTAEDTAVGVTLNGADVDGDTLSYVLDSANNGSVTFSGNVATFTPNANFSGSGRFSVRAYDGTSYSPSAQVTVTVTAANDVPTANDQSISVTEDSGSVATTLTGGDVDGDAVTYAILTQPAHGRVGLNNRVAVYTPDPDYSGADSFTFTVSDATTTSSAGTVSVNVVAVDDPPVALSTSGMTDGRTITLALEYSDVDSSLSPPTISREPGHGTVRVVDGALEYTPENGWVGMDRFSYEVTDGTTAVTADVRVSNLAAWTGGALAGWSQVGVNHIPFFADAGTDGWSSASPTYQADYILNDFYDMGLQTYRQLRSSDVEWESFEPASNTFATADSDVLFGMDEVEPRMTLFDTTFASPTAPWITDPNLFEKGMNAEAYEYLDDVIAAYGGEARIWEIGNEMFHWVSLDDPTADPSTIEGLPASYPLDGYSPEEQAEFMRDVAVYVRAAMPDAIIVLPSVIANNDSTNEWLSRVVAHTGSDWFDVVTYHAYEPWYSLRDDRAEFDAYLEAMGLGDKLVQLTETGTSSYSFQTAKTNYPNSPTTQASDIFRLLMPAYANGDSTVIWHTYRELSPSDTGTFGGLALLGYDSSPRAASYTMQLLSSELLPMVQTTDLTDRDAGQFVYQTWNVDGDMHMVAWGSGSWEVPSGLTEYTSVLPAADGSFTWHAVTSTTMTLTDVPVLLR